MDKREEALKHIDGQIASFKKEGLVETAGLLSRLKLSITGAEPIDEIGMMAVIAGVIEELERRIVAVESRQS